MADSRLVEIFQLAVEETKAGRLQWEEGPDLGEYDASLTKFTLRVYPDKKSYAMSILNEEGRFIARVDSSTLDESIAFFDGGEALDELYTLARSSALRVDTTLDAILSELKKKKESN